jgi:penicillin-binding protein 2
VGDRLGIDRIADFASSVGLGSKTGIDLPGEAEGLVPSSKWKLRAFRQKWYAGETISVAIGQGALTVTPIQLAYAMGGMAMGGVWNQPHLAKDAPLAEPRRRAFDPEYLAIVQKGMSAVVAPGGTAGAAIIPGVDFLGKTGSAQLASNDLVKSGHADEALTHDNGWFIGYAPRNNPEIVVAAVFEAGEHGSAAALIARDIVKAHFDKKAKRETQARPPEATQPEPAASPVEPTAQPSLRAAVGRAR